MSDWLPFMSLVVAALAVFVGPIVSYVIAKRQIASAAAISNKQIVAPLREQWISTLRNLVAELASSALHYHVTGFEDRSEQEYQRLTLLQHQISLMLNPLEEDHRELEERVEELVAAIGSRSNHERLEFQRLHSQMTDVARRVFKREWTRVKDADVSV